MSARRPIFNHLVAPLIGGRVMHDEAVQMLNSYRDEVLREAAEKIRGAHPMLLVRHPESPNAVALAMQSAMADLIDPDKENSANGTEADRA